MLKLTLGRLHVIGLLLLFVGGTTRAQIGALDLTFDPSVGPNDRVNSCLAQSDGKVVIAGEFNSMNGLSAGRIVRLEENGALDPTFLSGSGFNNSVRQAVRQNDGRIICGGTFTSYNGASCSKLVRLTASGALDPTFNASTSFNVEFVQVLSNGQVVAVGFTEIARYGSDGTLDNTFSAGTGLNGNVQSILVDQLGRILLSGTFTEYDGQPVPRLIRLLPDGTLDSGFSVGTGPNADVMAMLERSGGGYYIGGLFTTYNGIDRPKLCAIEENGSLDLSYNGHPDFVFLMQQLPSGKMMVAHPVGMARLQQNGVLDPTFPSYGQFFGLPKDFEYAYDGKLYVCGNFTSYNGVARSRIARVFLCGTAFYADADGDTFGDPNTAQVACTAPIGYVLNNTDCNDSDPSVHEVTTWYADTDNDGFGDVNAQTSACNQPLGFVTDNTDCDDTDPFVWAGATWFLDEDEDGYGDPNNFIVACEQPPGTSEFGTDCDDSDPNWYPLAGCDDGDELTFYDEVWDDCSCRGYGIQVQPVVWLQGADTGEDLMSGTLLDNGLIPLQEPYTSLGYSFVNGGGEVTTPTMLDPYPGNEELMAVDWVVVELRNSLNPSEVVDSRACLLTRNGTIHQATSMNAPEFHLEQGSYFVAVRHRNHLGFMSAGPVSLTQPTPPYLDFVSFEGTPTFGTDAMKPAADKRVMWTGDAVFDGDLKYTGNNSDRDRILMRIGGIVPTATANGYWNEDLNMDGQVKYTGESNDRDLILQNIGGVVPTAVRVDQLPDP